MSTVTAQKQKRSLYANRSYFENVAEAEKPIADRRALPIGRGGSESVQRRHHLLVGDVAALEQLAADGDKFPNPYNRAGYHYILEVLKAKGALTTADKVRRIKFATLYDGFKELTSKPETKDANGKTFWQRFKGRPARNDETGRDEEGKLLQNLEVMQRVTGKNCYGLKIDQTAKAVLGLKGACIDITRGPGGELYVSLNLAPTNFVEFKANPNHLPTGYKVNSENKVKVAEATNENKRRRKGETDAEAAPVKVVKVKAEKTEPAVKTPRVRKAKAVPAVAETVEPTETPETAPVSEPVTDGAVTSDQPAGETVAA